MDNYDNTPHTYTDRMLSITSALKGYRLMAEKFFEALVHYLSPSSKRKELPSQVSVKQQILNWVTEK